MAEKQASGLYTDDETEGQRGSMAACQRETQRDLRLSEAWNERSSKDGTQFCAFSFMAPCVLATTVSPGGISVVWAVEPWSTQE